MPIAYRKRTRQSIIDSARLELLMAMDVHPNPGPRFRNKNLPTLSRNTRPGTTQGKAHTELPKNNRGPSEAKSTAPFTITSLNVASLSNRLGELPALNPDVICLQEVALTAYTQNEAEYIMSKDEWGNRYKRHWGPPQPGRTCGGVVSNTVAERGGVATFVRKPRALIQCEYSAEDPVHLKNRWVQTRVSINGKQRWVHLFNLYCPSSNKANAEGDRERLLELILFQKRAELGEVPIVVIGDFNCDEERSPTLKKALEQGWVDAAAWCARQKGEAADPTLTRNPRPKTDKNGNVKTRARTESRVDRALVNHIAAQALSDCWVHDDVQGSDHRCLSLRLNLEAFKQKVWKYNVPKEIPQQTGKQPRPEPKLEDTDFHRHIERGDVNEAYRVWAAAAEDYLLDGVAVDNENAYRGRGVAREPVLKELCPPAVMEVGGAASVRQRQLTKLKRRLFEMQRQLERLYDSDHIGPLPYSILCMERNIDRLRVAANIEHCPVQLSGGVHDALVSVDAALDYVAGTLGENVAQQRNARRTSYGRAVADNLSSDRRHITAILKGPATSSDQVVESDGSITADLHEMDTVMREAWDEVFNAHKVEPSYGKFKARYGRYYSRHGMKAPPLTGACLQKVLSSKKAKGACGVDGWRVAELKRLPITVLEGLALLFNLIERVGRWPKALCTALVSLIPKGKGLKPLDNRPITVTSAIYRLWACARLRSVLPWQENWLTERQHSFRPKHGTETALMDLCLQFEESLLSGEELSGIALDFAKCFDLVPQRIAMCLMEDLGLDSGVHRAMGAMYEQLERRFRYPIGVGKPFGVSNGILQGCPLSVIMINALVGVMVKTLEAECEVKALAYADDAYLLSKLGECLQRAADGVVEFCDYTCMKMNSSKTTVLSTTGRCRVTVAEVVDGVRRKVPLKVVKAQKVLGTMLRLDAKGTAWNEPVGKAVAMCGRLAATSLGFGTKVWMISTYVLPVLMYSVPFSPPSDAQIEHLRTQVTKALWGVHWRGRSSEAVLTVLLKAHVYDPLCAVIYKSMRVLLRFWEALREIFKRIAELYATKGVTTPRGPVGNLVVRWLPALGWTWDQAMQWTGHRTPLHQLREALRQKRANTIVAKRSTMQGLGKGADPLTNRLWTSLQVRNPDLASCMRRVIVGGVQYLSPHVKQTLVAPPSEPSEDQQSSDSDDSSEDTEPENGGAAPTDGDGFACDVCDTVCMTTTALLRHQLWECRVATEVRDEALCDVLQNKEGWPLCLELHGILPRGMKCDHLGALQRYLATVVERRDLILQERRYQVERDPPWKTLKVGAKYPPPDTKEFLSVAKGPELRKYARPLLGWLRRLKWAAEETDAGVTAIELAIDFECSTGVSLSSTLHDTTELPTKARTIKRVLEKMQATWLAHKKRRAFPAAGRSDAKSLRSIGNNRCIGFSRRPIFASSETEQKLTNLKHQYRKERIARLRKKLKPSVGTRQMPQKGGIAR